MKSSLFQAIRNVFYECLSLRLRVTSAKHIARYLSKVGHIGKIQTPITLRKMITSKIIFSYWSLR